MKAAPRWSPSAFRFGVAIQEEDASSGHAAAVWSVRPVIYRQKRRWLKQRGLKQRGTPPRVVPGLATRSSTSCQHLTSWQ